MISRMLVVFLISVVTYRNVYRCDFVFDDHLAIRRNRDVDTSETSWRDVWSHDFWGKDLKAIDSHKSWRPITVLSFRLDHYFFEFNASYYHVMNSVYHALVSSCVVPFCFYLFCRDHESTNRNVLDQALMAGILFAVHPVHVEAVAGTVGRADILCAGFAMLSFFLHGKGFQFISILMLIFATLCKDTGITLVIVLSAQHVLSKVKSDQWMYPHRWGVVIWSRIVTIYVGVLMLYMYVRSIIMNESTLQSSGLIRRTENPFAFTNGTTWVMSTAYLHGRYANLLVNPLAELCAEYSYNCIPAVQSVFDSRNVLSVLTYTVSCLAIAYGLVARHQGVLLCLLWIFIPMIPASNIFMKVGTLLAERLLYVPSLGYCCLVAFGIRHLFFDGKNSNKRFVVWSLFGAIVLVMIHRTQLRTVDW